MAVNDIVQARIKEYHAKELQKWEDSIPLSLRGYDYDELMDNNWNGKISNISRNKVINYIKDPTPFLLLHGGSGLGKTIMGVEIIKKLISEEKITSAIYMDTPTLLHEMSYSNHKQDLLRKTTHPDLLLLDDVGAGSTEMTPTRKSGVWSIINKRWTDGKKTIITTNLPITSQNNVTGLQDWFGISAWDRISDNLTDVIFKGNSMRGNVSRSRRSNIVD